MNSLPYGDCPGHGQMYMNERTVFRYDILRDPERWLEINKVTGDVSARRPFNIRSTYLRNGVYNAVVRATGLWNPFMRLYPAVHSCLHDFYYCYMLVIPVYMSFTFVEHYKQLFIFVYMLFILV